MNTNPTPLRLKLISLSFLAALLLSVFNAPALAAPMTVPTGERLRTLAGSSFLIGFASRNDFWSMSDAAQYQEVARTEFNFLTPENAMKFDAVHPQENTYSFTQADQHVAFAQANGMQIHGHTLIWHNQLPQWVTNRSWTSAQLTAMMNNHIDTVMGHWVGQIAVWDVVNEAFNEDGTRRSSVWQNTLGNSYIEMAFRRADAADPATKLIYNDYNVETINAKSTAMYNMVVDFKNRGVPIDGVGFQMHLDNNALNYQSLADNMARFAALGVEIYITEMDVRYPEPISQANLNAQATVYSNVLSRCKAQPMCKALQVWGITDKYSWIPDVFQGFGDALPFDDNYNAKPAYYALQAGLGPNNTPTPTPTRTPTSTPIGPTFTPTRTPTRTNTPIGPTFTPTRTPTRTSTPIGPTFTPTRTPTRTNTPTPGTGGACSPLTATITAPFVFDGAGTFCWRSNNLGTYINSWNLVSLTVNGVNYSNIYAFTSNLPPKMPDGYWYISYRGNFAWSHFEAK
jgi:endo-1,4-beta-xylanase